MYFQTLWPAAGFTFWEVRGTINSSILHVSEFIVARAALRNGGCANQIYCRPFLEDPSAIPAKLCRRMERHIKELFVFFAAQPETPSDNNGAERSLRHLVVSRKISGGIRSRRGTHSKMTLASLFGTWRVEVLNPLTACRQLLASHQV